MTQVRGTFSWVVLQLAILIAVIVAAEGLLRLAGVGETAPPRFSLLQKTTGPAGVVYQPKYTEVADPSIGEAIALADGNEFLLIEAMRPWRAVVPRPADTLRVVVMGSSPTFGLADTPPLASLIGQDLAGTPPFATVETIDLTNRRMTLEMMHLLVPDVLALQPQVVVVAVSGAWPTMAPPPADDTPAEVSRWRRLLRRSVLIKLLWDWLAPEGAIAAEPTRSYLPLPRELPDQFDERRAAVAKNVNAAMRRARDEQMLAVARKLVGSGRHVIFVGSLVNVVKFRPLLSLHRDELSAKQLESFVNHYAEGCTRADKGDCRGAVPEFDRANEIDPHFANLHFRRGLCLLALGNVERAADAFFAAQRDDLSPERAALAPGEEPVDELGALGVRFLNPYELLRQETGEPLPKGEWFHDLNHLRPDGQKLIADLIAREISVIFAK